MSKLYRILFFASLLLLALAFAIARQPSRASAFSGNFIVTLTPTAELTLTSTPIPTQTPLPSITPTSEIEPPNPTATPTATPEATLNPPPPSSTPDGGGGNPAPTRTPPPVLLPNTGETPPLSPWSSLPIWLVGGLGLLAGLALGLGLHKRMFSWVIKILGVVAVLAVIGISVQAAQAPGAQDSRPAQVQVEAPGEEAAPF